MNTFDEIAHLTELACSKPKEELDRVKVTLNLRVDDVYLVDRMAKALDMTRQDLVSTILHTSLPDAVRGYFKIVGDDPLEALTWEEFMEKVYQGEYFE